MSVYRVPEDCESLYVSDVEDSLGIGREEIYMISNGRPVSRSEPLQHGHIYYIWLRVLGGKGGFGSMLRAIGAQIEKTTSREACRDLSGRRIRDVNNEKKLKDWAAGQADRDREKAEREERRRAKRAKYLEDTPAKMDNPEYDAQYSEIMKKAESAMQEGLTRLKEGGGTSRKRKAESSTSGALDKYDRWNMVGGVNLEDLDSDSGSESGEGCSAFPGISACPQEAVSSSSTSSPSQDGPSSPKPTAAATITSSTEASVEDAPPCKVAKVEGSGDDICSSSCDKSPQQTTPSEACEASGDGSNAEANKPDVSKSQTPPVNGDVSSSVESTEPIDLDQISGAEELQSLGMERLKADLMRRGLKCGGSLEERAQRLFSIKGLAEEDIPSKLLAKGKGQGKSSRK